jgi:hypothetical protein
MLMDDGTRDGWCRRCYHDWLMSGDEDAAGWRCIECKVIHLKTRMYEKLHGWLCHSCAKKYDEALLKKMVSA